ncbi:MAG: class I SAM-dependent methyltransferase [Candidatus Krumholzibacteria bacterium]|nr:class I SAM-dependent methyltransferase [Candidatus Krumholzibacteria bacterium]
MNAASLQDHYSQPDLTSAILAALRKAGLDIDNLKREDLNLLDEFHIRGQAATLELAPMAELSAEHAVLDLGCGVGGPARLLAAQYGCHVVGLDLVEAYCEAATELTRRVGLSELVKFQQGDMREMPFADNSFDCVWSQNTQMNIPDKGALASDVRRVLRPGGRAVFYEVCAGNGQPVILPVPWASKPEHNHLCAATVFHQNLLEAGLEEVIWQDVTTVAVDWLDGLSPAMSKNTVDTRRRPSLGLLMGATAGLKSRNLARNIREGRVVVVQGIFTA